MQKTKISLHESHPEIAAQWHPTKNVNLTPHDVSAGSNKKVWWICQSNSEHEWCAPVHRRTAGSICPVCVNRIVIKSNALSTTHPELAAQWHPTKNGNLAPDKVSAGGTQKVWWKCQEGDDHEWQAILVSRKNGTGCPICSGHQVVFSTCLSTTHPELAKEWHFIKNGELTPNSITAGSSKKGVWWKCQEGDDHEWNTTVINRVKGSGCPMCINRIVVKSNSLSITHPMLAAQWHPTKNGSLTPYEVSAGSEKKVYWQCEKRKDHYWEAPIYNRTGKSSSGCPSCSGHQLAYTDSLAYLHPEIALQLHSANAIPADKLNPNSMKSMQSWVCTVNKEHIYLQHVRTRISNSLNNINSCTICNSLLTLNPELAKQWHPTKNGDLVPSSIRTGSHAKVWWICSINSEHEWQAQVYARYKGGDCPYCSNKRVNINNSLAALFPLLIQEWHTEKNGAMTPDKVVSGSGKIVWWQCVNNKDHIWQAAIELRTKRNYGCPGCNSGWTIDNIRRFVTSLLPYIDQFTEAELYVLFQQNGLLDISDKSKGSSFIAAFKTGRFPKEELEKFVNHEASLVDEFLADSSLTLESKENELDENRILTEDDINIEYDDLDIVETQDVLTSLNKTIFANLDHEAASFFIVSAVAKIWRHAFIDEDKAQNQINRFINSDSDNAYAQEVVKLFNQDYLAAKALEIPSGYSFYHKPNLMQLYTAHLIKSRKRIGNWSGTGAGKTLSAILASRVINAKLTVICCPNNVIENWKKVIEEIYPCSIVHSKSTDFIMNHETEHHYLIFNYEFFQQPAAEAKLDALIRSKDIDFIVIDEIHFAKQREKLKSSLRKEVVSKFLSAASEKNKDLHVLGMSATPVINNLFEGKTMIELVTGTEYPDLNIHPTISNCISLYQKFMLHGIRWVPQYNIAMNQTTPEIDCSQLLPEIKAMKTSGTMIDLEALLTKVKIPAILENLQPKTIIYTHYRQGIENILFEAIEQKGWRVALFNGETKTGLDNFIYGNADVLIATSCISTGVDGLQKVCNRLIINSLPWTHAEFDQLRGRIYRQGQIKKTVEIIIPIAFAEGNGKRWSWCESRLKHILFKKSIADAAIDGVIPEGQLRTPAQAYHDAMQWIQRLDDGNLYEIERQKISKSLSGNQQQAHLRKISDLSLMNRQINSLSSGTTHQRFISNPSEWHNYHAAYRAKRKDWEIIPYQEAIKWCKIRPKELIIGDFGCGEAFLAAELENKVYSFDHVAINDNVIACDMSNIPLQKDSLDVAIFSLSLMGTNFIDYLREAHRCLKLDKHLWIVEPTSRIQNIALFIDLLERLGFDKRTVIEKSKFTFIEATKSNRDINEIALQILLKNDILI